MAMFGWKKRLEREGIYSTPPYAPEIQSDPRQRETPIGRSSTGRAIAGYLGDALAQIGGMKPIYAPAMALRHQEEREDAAAQAEREAAASQQRAVPLGNGGFGTWSPSGGLQILREPTPDTPAVPALQQNFEWMKSLPPEDQKLAATMLPGYAFTPAGLATSAQRAGAVAEAAAVARARHRAPPAAARSKPMSLPGGFILDN